LPVDGCGLTLPSKNQRRAQAKLVYLTPVHQFPTGVTMSLDRRLEWLAYAAQSSCRIFEDDYDGEYRFRGKPLPTLQGLDRAASVIYAFSFSKLLFPTLRLGILIVPQNLVDAVAALRTISDRYPPYLEQAVLCDFFTEGHFGHHIRRMRELYAERLSVLLESSREHLSGLLDVENTKAGLQTVGWLCKGIQDVAASQAAARHGVEVLPVSYFASAMLARQGLVLGFASAKPAAIRSGVERLAKALADLVLPAKIKD
jgi:GntR family transcriptional regulator/MocR family aminotransferase